VDRHRQRALPLIPSLSSLRRHKLLGKMSTAPAQPAQSHITKAPGVCGGKPCITGTRIRVLDIYIWHELQGKSPDEIVHDYPQLSMADVYAALTYLWDNRGEILESLRHEQDLSDSLRKLHPSKLPADPRDSHGPSIPPR
jgi:uncharacterized protein (DUF433 family)